MAMEPARRKRLQQLWVKLLENVTEYDRIIDGLFQADVLTGPMKEKVKAKHGTDQLRAILDILPKRGNHAFDVFYDVLVDSGEDIAADLLCPERAEERKKNQFKIFTSPSGVQESRVAPIALPEDDELPSRWPDIEAHDPFRTTVVHVPDNDTLMKNRFERAVAGSGAVYPLHRPERGIFLLLSNQYFKDARANNIELADRDGTAKDCHALDTLFCQLGFHVVKRLNLTAEEMLNKIKEQAAKDHTNYDCFACAVLTHGEKDHIYGTDGKLVSLDLFRDAVDGDNCPTLVGKPKLFFIQACQGQKLDGGVGAGGYGAAGPDPSKPTATIDQDMDQVASNLVNIKLRDKTDHDAAKEGRVSSKSDVFVALATVPDYVSWRNTEWGTWFVQALVYVLSRLAHKYDLMQLMTKVNRLVSKAETRKGLKQVSVFKSALTSDLYFFPGLQRGIVSSHSEVDMAKPEKLSPPSVPVQSASVQPSEQLLAPAQQAQSQPISLGSGITAQPSSDGVDGMSRLVE
ncbi:hypothetical protein V1264_007657 [Littorina saxatilis]|uniref:Uncharacterized protein n=1 Tax=Littorina saxatilis TaxID=31220 RepID=A0AAN9G3E7_9CAEN